MKKLIAIDGNNILYRAFFALPSMMTKSGTPTGAIHGFLSTLFKLVQAPPDYLLVAFDMHGPTFRHEQYDGYKAGRSETPDDLRKQIPLMKKLLEEMGIKVLECPRFEADDILGTFSRIADEKGIFSLLVTGDRDALQLISPNTHVLMPKKANETVEYDEALLLEQYGLSPKRMPDLKGLMGDSSDNLPGIPGVGEKTARKLLEKYGNLENALAHANDEKGALQKKLLEGAESARMSYRLGLIDRHAPVPVSLEDCAFVPARMSGGALMMQELELRSLLSRLPEGAKQSMPAAKEEKKIEYMRIGDEASLRALTDQLKNAERLAFHMGDTLTLSADGVMQYDIVLGATLLEPGLDEGTVYSLLKPLFENQNIKKLVFDAKRHRHILARFGICLEGVVFDGMLADYLLHALHPAGSLKTLAAERLGISEGNAAALVKLCESMMPELEEKGLGTLYREMELPLERVLFDMEHVGFTLNSEVLREMSTAFKKRIDAIAEEIFVLAGEPFNILSTKQLGTVLFEKLGLPPWKKTKSGYSTDAESLEKIEDKNPIVKLIIEYRTLSKLCSTFLDGLLAVVRPESGRVHTSFNQNVTATGRISSTEPNLQNIPVRTELGREIRKAFVPSKGNVLVDADYSQIELRLLAHMSGDESMIRAFREGDDIHRRTASEVFDVPFDAVTSAQRSAAKAVNFGIVYGISDFGLARNLNITRKEAARYIELYLLRYPGIHRYMQESVESGRRDGFVTTLMGRRRDLPELKSSNFNTRSFGERVAMNMPIQGTAADIIKLSMVRVHDALKREGLKAKLVLQIHDELIIDAPKDEAERVAGILRSSMENVINLSVPLYADVKIGNSWFETK
ncbi:MAG: DNA polymerase I [Clostridiales bacterium]|nr:DNA polymerase I [Clostridiales bacterium]